MMMTMMMMLMMQIMLMMVVTDECILHSLKSMGPAAIELELSLLCTLPARDAAADADADEDVDLVVDFIQFITHMFSTKKDIDLASSYLGLLLKVSADLSRSLWCSISLLKVT